MKRIGMLRRHAASALVIGVGSLTAACAGGAGSSPTPTPTPANRAPGFTSAASASVIENSTGAIYTAAAGDADGDVVTISISGGADATAFTLTGGALSFVAAPDFDRPGDANTDNSYELTLTASDGKGGTTSLALSVKVTNDHEGVNLTRVATGFGANAVIATRWGASGLLIVSQDGLIREVDAASGASANAGNAFKAGESGRVLAVTDYGVFGIAMLDIAGRGVIMRTIPLLNTVPQRQYNQDWALAAPSAMQPRAAFVTGGNGALFITIGDPSGNLAQDPASGYGKLHRVLFDPYCGASVWTYCLSAEVIGDGVHAPAGGGGYLGQSFLIDRGTGQQEEINYFNQAARPIDFGWPYREGTYERVASPPPAVIGPSLTYGRDGSFYAGKGLTGSVLYTGAIASLTGKVLLTDESGKIFALPATFLADGILHAANTMENRTADFAPATGTIEKPVAIVQDVGGRLFVLDSDGELYGTS